MTRTITSGSLTPQQFKEAQEQDPKCQELEAANDLPPHFYKKQGIWFYEHEEHGHQLVLPEILLDGLITTHHHSVNGLHHAEGHERRRRSDAAISQRTSRMRRER